MLQDLLPPAIWSLELAAVVLTLASIGYVFRRFGQPGWAVLVPIYGFLVFWLVAQNEKTPKDVIMTIMMLGIFLIPGINVLVIFGLCLAMAGRTKHGGFYGVCLFLFPFLFWPHLAWSLRRRGVQA